MKYTTPEMDVILVAAADMITVSTGNNNQGGGNKGEFEDEEL